jgi:hypothetical protein
MSAVAAAVAVAAAHGLRVTDPVVLRDRLNVLVHLRPAPVVARVAGTIASVRPGEEWIRRELAIAGGLAAAGAPAVAPSAELPPGPHHHGGHVLSVWTFVPERDAPADPRAAGAALRACHAAMLGLRVGLPPLGHLTEAEALLAGLVAREAIDLDAADELQRGIDELLALMGALRSPVLPLHGDAHLGNVLNGPDGPLWNDWEDAAIGPPGWDAACLLANARVTGEGEAAAEAALAASGLAIDPAELELWIDARTLQGAVWGAYIEQRHPERRAVHGGRWLESARRRATR